LNELRCNRSWHVYRLEPDARIKNSSD